MSKKTKLIGKLLERPKNFTWDEACALMKQCGFERVNAKGGGSGRMFVHLQTRKKCRLHEPHPENTMKRYMLDLMIETLQDVGEIK